MTRKPPAEQVPYFNVKFLGSGMVRLSMHWPVTMAGAAAITKLLAEYDDAQSVTGQQPDAK
jgi:hypothetical protein